MFYSEGNIVFRKLHASCIKKVLVARFCQKINPGTRRRLKIAEDTEQSDLDDLDYEANFELVGRSHHQHIKEMDAMKEKKQYDIVKQKYFKTKYPNFLTWHDKEQIRMLHKKDPEEWNLMKLSEGFPALPEIIKKVIKSKWRMENAEKMKDHDVSVRENWKKLKNNEFKELPVDLVTHLKKFSNREFNYHDYDNVVDFTKIEYEPKLTCTEFSEIITSYEELKRKKENHTAIESESMKENEFNSKIKNTSSTNIKNNDICLGNKTKSSMEEDTFITEPIKNRESMTLGTLRNKLQRDLEMGTNVALEDVPIIELKWDKNIEVSKPTTTVDQFDYTKYNTGKLMKIDEKKPMDYNHLIYPEKIKIPKKILKKGYTYKLNDCFYASDGTFLYRVPGML